MKTYLKVRNITRNAELGRKIRVASSFMDRAIGLLSTACLRPGEGLWITPCASIHTFFMRYPIDALFIDGAGTVLSRKTLPSWRISAWVFKSRGVLELPAGTLERTRTQTGDRIEFLDLVDGREGS